MFREHINPEKLKLENNRNMMTNRASILSVSKFGDNDVSEVSVFQVDDPHKVHSAIVFKYYKFYQVCCWFRMHPNIMDLHSIIFIKLPAVLHLHFKAKRVNLLWKRYDEGKRSLFKKLICWWLQTKTKIEGKTSHIAILS